MNGEPRHLHTLPVRSPPPTVGMSLVPSLRSSLSFVPHSRSSREAGPLRGEMIRGRGENERQRSGIKSQVMEVVSMHGGNCKAEGLEAATVRSKVGR